MSNLFPRKRREIASKSLSEGVCGQACENFAQFYPQPVDNLTRFIIFQHFKIPYCLWITMFVII